jgi:asparagine synthase (glutamine-hydrolysing)
MPGISLIYDHNGLPQKREEYDRILGELNLLEHHNSHTFRFDDNVFIGWNKYEEYPIQVVNHNLFTFLIEGKIYNKDITELEFELVEIAELINQNNYSTKISQWLKKTDGDYIIYIVNNSSNDIYVLNDIFGRLPVYYFLTGKGIIISRYLRFITRINNVVNFNMIGISQFLLLGYMLGKHTILENIFHLRPASLIKIEGSNVNIEVMHNFNFEVKSNRNNKFKDNMKTLSGLFTEASVNRINPSGKNVVAISGGLDSRAVVSCMNKAELPFTALTMKYKSGYTVTDSKLGGEIAKLLNLDWHLVDVAIPKGVDVYDLLKIKEGMNSLFTVGILPFYKEIRKEFGNNIHYFTGDNGDKLIFTVDRPIPNFKDIDDLTKYIITEHAIIRIDRITDLTNIKMEEIFEDLKELLLSFPETDLKQKYIHFRVNEKPFKFAYQGEDRHRNYFWNVSPFWSIQFFNYLMNCSDESKLRHRTFRALIQSYSKEVMDLEYTNFKSSITSLKGKVFLLLVYYVYPRIPLKIKKMIKPSFFEGDPKISEDSAIIRCINQILNSSNFVKRYINIDNSYQIAGLRKIALYIFFTIVSIIEELGENKSSIRHYFDEEFK